MGLLDDILGGDNSSNGIGGLLSYLQSPLYRTPDNSTQDFSAALKQGMGNPDGLVPMQTPGTWDRPGINYTPAPPMAGLSPFTAGAAPLAGLPSAPVMPPQAIPQAAPQAAPAPQQPQEAGPINTMNVGGYQMPQFGSVADYMPQNTVPANAQPTQGQLPQATPQQASALPPALQERSILSRIGSPDGLIARLTGNDTRSIAQQNLTAQYHAMRQTLIDNGEDPRAAASKAMLAVMNPEAGKTIINEALTNKEKFQQTGEDSFGNKTYGFVNERNQTINGKGSGDTQGSSSFLAPGVKQVDSSLTGKDYLGQFSPEVQAAVQNYIDGKSTPTGNPRKGFTQAVKMIAQKVGADTGQSVDDATYAARRTMRNQLSSSAPASLGGQINIGNTAAGHLADLSQKALELGNYDTGIAPLTAAVNGVRGLGTEQAAKMEALKGAAQHYGQEITKFYAGSPGGTAERDRFIESVNGARSPKELAAILATEGELMRSRLDALGGQIKGVLGEEGAAQYPVLRKDGQDALARLEQNVSKLKGGQSAAPVAPLAPGQSTTIGGVTIRRVN